MLKGIFMRLMIYSGRWVTAWLRGDEYLSKMLSEDGGRLFFITIGVNIAAVAWFMGILMALFADKTANRIGGFLVFVAITAEFLLLKMYYKRKAGNHSSK